MGPIAGIGDTIQAILFRPIVAVLAASLAMAGSSAGPLIMFIFGLCWTGLKFPQVTWGYKRASAWSQQWPAAAWRRSPRARPSWA